MFPFVPSLAEWRRSQRSSLSGHSNIIGILLKSLKLMVNPHRNRVTDGRQNPPSEGEVPKADQRRLLAPPTIFTARNAGSRRAESCSIPLNPHPNLAPFGSVLSRQLSMS